MQIIHVCESTRQPEQCWPELVHEGAILGRIQLVITIGGHWSETSKSYD